MKKIIAMILVIALTAAISVGATMAYLTDTDEDVNVMTLGNVQIAQNEYERVVDANGEPVLGAEGVDFTANYGINQSYKLRPFTQAKPAYPAVYTNAAGTEDWDDFQQLWNQVGAPGSNDLFDDSVKNVIDKFVFVENTGKSDCYYRTLVAVEHPTSVDGKMIHLNVNHNSRFDRVDSNGFRVGLIEINGVPYDLYNFTYNQKLVPGEVSRPSLLQVFLDPLADNDDCAAFGETWEILVFSQAVQTNGFASAQDALNTAFGAITTTNHPWAEGASVPEVVDNVADLDAALLAGDDVVLTKDLKFSSADTNANSGYGATGIAVKGTTLDGAGHTLGITNWGTWDAAVVTTGGTIKNLTINSGMRGIFMGGATADVYIDNVVIDGTIYTFNSDGGNINYGVYISNSTLNGWTSHSNVHKEVVYTNCNFGEGNGYAYCRPYGPTSFVGCNFEAGYEIDTVGIVTFENCTINGQPLTAANLGELVTNTANASVK